MFSKGDKVRVIQPLHEHFGEVLEIAWETSPNNAVVWIDKYRWRTAVWIPSGYLAKIAKEECLS
jgi:hypothetical protein